jgi:membrane-associated protease RseP (regulator of RpoE activity)
VASAPIPPGAGSEIDRLRALVSARFPVYETRVSPLSVLFLVHADPATLEGRFDALRQEMWTRFYIPQLRREGGEYLIEVVRRPPQSPWGSWSNIVLLALTVVSTIFAGAFLWIAWRGGTQLLASDFLWGGVYFALPLLAILGLHELAHFVLARYHRVEASWPYFIPVPPPFLLFGTFGAFISLREPIPSKKALLDIGASGPLAGLAVAIPVTLVGLTISLHAPAIPVTDCGPTIAGFSYGGLTFGPSLLWSLLGLFVPASALSHLDPLALAGWVGLLVTAINLLPAGQLDGGHVFRALFGDRARFVSYAAVGLLILLGFFYEGWFLFALLVFVLGMRHPPPLNDISPLDGKRWAIGGLAVAVLVAGFVVVPIAAPVGGAFTVAPGTIYEVAPPNGFAMADNFSVGVHNTDLTSHAYTVTASIAAVYATVNGSSVELTGPALQSFIAGSRWTVTPPGGATMSYSGSGSFSIPGADAFVLDSGSSSTVQMSYLNPEKAVVTLQVEVAQLCSGGAGPRSTSLVVN